LSVAKRPPVVLPKATAHAPVRVAMYVTFFGLKFL